MIRGVKKTIVSVLWISSDSLVKNHFPTTGRLDNNGTLFTECDFVSLIIPAIMIVVPSFIKTVDSALAVSITGTRSSEAESGKKLVIELTSGLITMLK